MRVEEALLEGSWILGMGISALDRVIITAAIVSLPMNLQGGGGGGRESRQPMPHDTSFGKQHRSLHHP